jgi:hypothetical protein
MPGPSAAIQQGDPQGNPLALLFVILMLGTSLAALALVCQALSPRLVSRARATVERTPGRAFAVGLINLIFFGLLVVACFTIGATFGAVALVGLLLATIVASVMAIGMTAVARLVGERLRPDDGLAARQLLVGVVVLELAALVPLVGWIAVTTLTLLTGGGAVIIALVRRPRPEDL